MDKSKICPECLRSRWIRRIERLMANQDIRNLIAQAGVRHYEVAKQIGIGEQTLCVWLREELPKEKKARIKNAILDVAKSKGVSHYTTDELSKKLTVDDLLQRFERLMDDLESELDVYDRVSTISLKDAISNAVGYMEAAWLEFPREDL